MYALVMCLPITLRIISENSQPYCSILWPKLDIMTKSLIETSWNMFERPNLDKMCSGMWIKGVKSWNNHIRFVSVLKMALLCKALFSLCTNRTGSRYKLTEKIPWKSWAQTLCYEYRKSINIILILHLYVNVNSCWYDDRYQL